MPFFEKTKKRPASVKNPLLEVGAEISLKQIDGQLFSCFTLVPVKSGPNFVKCKYLIAITNYQLVEMYPHPHKVGLAVTAQVHYLHTLAKLKFKKGDPGVLILEFKGDKVSKLIMKDPSACVDYLKAKMKSMGIKGNLRPKNEKDIANAQNCFQKAKEIETLFTQKPSVDLIKEMMDLLRRAAEKFSEANDNSYREVTDYISRFLQRPDVLQMLDESAGLVKHDNTGFELGEDTPQKATPVGKQTHDEATNDSLNATVDTATTTPTAVVSNATATAVTSAGSMQLSRSRSQSNSHNNSSGGLRKTSSLDSEGFGLKPDDVVSRSHSNDSEADYYTKFLRHLKLPDEHTEFTALQQALTYALNEDDAKYDVIRRRPVVTTAAVAISTGGGGAVGTASKEEKKHEQEEEQQQQQMEMENAIDAELKVMLSTMTSEFADLLNSFERADEMDFEQTAPATAV